MTVLFSVEPSHNPSGSFTPSVLTPSATMQQRPFSSIPSTINAAKPRNVKRWQSGDMCLRWTAAGMLEAETQFRKIVGYSDLAKLALAVERDLATRRVPLHPTTHEKALTTVNV